MATTRINAVSATATTFAGDDFLPIDGNVNATRRLLLTSLFASPSAIGSVTPAAGAFTTGTFSSTLGVTGVATLGNGAILGTPASGTVTNLTGTASININGTVGATTPSTVAGTTGTFSGAVAINNASLKIGTNSGYTYFVNDQMNFGFSENSAYTGVINYTGYNGGTTQFRNLDIYDGKSTRIAQFTSTGLNSTAIGATTPSTGAFSTLSATGTISTTTSSITSIVASSSGENAGVYGTTSNHAIKFYANNSSKFQIDANAATALLSSTGLAVTGVVTASVAKMGTGFAGFAEFSDSTRFGASGTYSFLSETGGTSTYVNASTGGNVYLRIANADKAVVSSTGLAVTGTLSCTTGANFATSSGNVGIGTASPLCKTEVYDSAVLGAFVPATRSTWRVLQVKNYQRTNSSSAAGISFQGDNINGDTGSAGIVGINTNTTGGVMDLAFLTAEGNVSVERMRILANGNVGIGTASPRGQLESYIATATSAAPLIIAAGGGYVSSVILGNFESSDATRANRWTFGRDNQSTGDFVLAHNGTRVTTVTTAGAAITGTLSSTGNLSTTGDLRVTDTGSSHFILIGNQDSGGANKPNIIRGVNGTLSLGYGTSWSSSGGGTLTSIADISSTGLAVTGALSVTSTLSTTPAASANAVQGSGGSFVTVVALPTGWGTVHVAVAENGTTNIGYYQVDFVNGTGIAIQAKTGTTAGATTGQLTFQLSGSNLQARGANATAPTTVKYWIVTGTF